MLAFLPARSNIRKEQRACPFPLYIIIMNEYQAYHSHSFFIIVCLPTAATPSSMMRLARFYSTRLTTTTAINLLSATQMRSFSIADLTFLM
jgi:hypothetical protein